ncbi:hypothetical protein GCM10010401_16360 [Rarobacter faecitabidus]|uniref:Uncharacterized protein n=1 Tax=Rarobacter faecitabidus TaxID=13243 RepID=A0A542ZX85_RARFA|nr:hypothetical protein [Rarobacter faecitabidus]TQL64962.1 hypothetical protein FB461_1495 [Rarobacter faecitabidus]
MFGRKKIAVALGAALLVLTLGAQTAANAATTVNENETKLSDDTALSVWAKYGTKTDGITLNTPYFDKKVAGIHGNTVKNKATSVFVANSSSATPYSVRTMASKTSKSGIKWTYKTKYLPAGVKKYKVKSGTGTSTWGNTGSQSASTITLSNGRIAKSSYKAKTNNKANGSNTTGSFSVLKGKKTLLKASWKTLEASKDDGSMKVTGTVTVTKNGKTKTTKVNYSYGWNSSYTKKKVAKGGQGSALHLKLVERSNAVNNALLAGSVKTSL